MLDDDNLRDEYYAALERATVTAGGEYIKGWGTQPRLPLNAWSQFLTRLQDALGPTWSVRPAGPANPAYTAVGTQGLSLPIIIKSTSIRINQQDYLTVDYLNGAP